MTSDDLSGLRIDESQRGVPRSVGKRKARVRWWQVAVVCAAAATGISAWLGLLTPPLKVRPVKASRTFVSRALTDLNASGYVVAQRKAAVSSKATGRLARLHVEEGNQVKKGEILATLENRDLTAVLEEARAGLRVAQARLNNAEAELEEATLHYNRQKSLRSSGAISAQAFDAVEARYKKGVAVEKSARFGVEKAKASVQVAQVNVDYSLIRAPFDGVILTKNADEGEVVAPFGGSLNAKAAVVTMADMNSLLVEVDVSESSLEKVKVGKTCEIRLDAFPRDRFSGRVYMIVPTADRSKATVLTKVKFNERDERVLPEMSAKVAFLSRPLKPDEKEPFLGLPVSAIRDSPTGKRVFLIRGRRVRAVPVETGRRWGVMVEILSGIKEEDPVVLDAGKNLADGARIEVVE